MRYVIGVDQGGSGTRAVICTLDGQILGKGLGPGSCHAFDGMEYAMDATHTAVQNALDQAGTKKNQAEIYVGGTRAQTGRMSTHCSKMPLISWILRIRYWTFRNLDQKTE